MYFPVIVLASGGLFEATGVQRLIDDHMRGRADRRKQLWTLLMFRRWQKSPFGTLS